MEFFHYFSSITFVMLTADQFVGRDDGLPEQQNRDSPASQTNRTYPLMPRKNQSQYCKLSGCLRYRAQHCSSSQRIISFFYSRNCFIITFGAYFQLNKCLPFTRAFTEKASGGRINLLAD